MTWRTAPLGDLLEEPLVNGKSVPSREGGFPVLRLTALRDGSVDLRERKQGAWARGDAEPYLVHEADFLVTRGNGSLKLVGKGGLVGSEPVPVAFPDTMIRIRPNTHLIEPRFLTHAWSGPDVRTQIENLARTTAGIYKINQSHLRSINLPLPSLDEQRRIVDILEDHLSRLDAAEAGLEGALAKLDALRDRCIVRPVIGADRTEHVDSDLAQVGTADGVLPSLPMGWSWGRLGKVAEVVGGVTKDAKKQSDPNCVEVPYLRVANVQRGELKLDEVQTIRVDPARAKALALQEGDVLLNEGGDRDKLARGWVWEGQIEECIHQNHVFRVRLKDDRLDPYFLSWTANTLGGRWAERNGKQSVNLASISLTMIRQMPVVIPPKGEAAQIAVAVRERLDSLARLESSIEAARQRSAGVRRALLKAAFSGQLTGTSSDLDRSGELI